MLVSEQEGEGVLNIYKNYKELHFDFEPISREYTLQHPKSYYLIDKGNINYLFFSLIFLFAFTYSYTFIRTFTLTFILSVTHHSFIQRTNGEDCRQI